MEMKLWLPIFNLVEKWEIIFRLVRQLHTENFNFKSIRESVAGAIEGFAKLRSGSIKGISYALRWTCARASRSPSLLLLKRNCTIAADLSLDGNFMKKIVITCSLYVKVAESKWILLERQSFNSHPVNVSTRIRINVDEATHWCEGRRWLSCAFVEQKTEINCRAYSSPKGSALTSHIRWKLSHCGSFSRLLWYRKVN